MPQKTYTGEFRITGNAAQELDRIAGAGKDASKSLDQSSQSTQDAAVQTEGFTDRLNKLKVAYDLVIGRAQAAVKEFAAQEAAAGRMQRAFDQAGASAKDLASAEELITRNRDKFGLGVAEQRDALRNLIEETGNAKTAQQDFALAIDIASQEAIDFSAATEALAKARRGETEELKRFTGITKDAALEIGRIEGDATRGAAAIDILRDSYEGAAEANAGTEERVAALNEQINSLEASLGSIVVDVGDLTGKLLELATASDDGEFSIANFTTAFGNFSDAVGEATDELTSFIDEASSQELADIFLTLATSGLLGGGDKTIGKVINRRDDRRLRERTAAEDAAARKGQAAQDEALLGMGGQSERGGGGGGLSRAEYEALVENTEDAKPKRKRRKRKEREAPGERVKSIGELTDEVASEVDADRANDEYLKSLREQAAATREQIELRNELAQLQLAGLDYEAEKTRILKSNLTPLEKAVALKELEATKEEEIAEVARERAAAREAMVDSAADTAKGLIGSLLEAEQAERAAALVDGLKFQYKAIGSAASYDFFAAAQYQLAAGQAFAVAGGAGSGGGAAAKSGGGKPSAEGGVSGENTEAQTRRNARIFAEEMERVGSREIPPIIINNRSLGRMTPREAAAAGRDIRAASLTKVGGARNTVRI